MMELATISVLPAVSKSRRRISVPEPFDIMKINPMIKKERSHVTSLGILLGCSVFLFPGQSLLAQTLTVTSGLQLWLKADAGITGDGAGNVLSWADQSTSPDKANQTAGAPDAGNAPKIITNALNGKPVLRFDGLDDYLSIQDTDSLSMTGDLTTFFVVKFDDFTNYRAVWAKTNINFPAATDWYTLPGSGVPRLYRGAGTGAGLASFDGTVPLVAGSYLTVGFGMEGNTASHFLNTTVTGCGTLNVEEADSDTPLLIGSRGDLFTRMKGDIAEIVVYDRALSAAERDTVVTYLGQKYGIANLAPTSSLSVTPAGPSHPAGTTLTLTATATDPDGSISNVKFFSNGALLGTATAPPYKIRVKLDTPGTFSFTAKAEDNKLSTKDSAAVSRSVAAGAAPVLGVTSNLQLWLKADKGVNKGVGDRIVSWDDQSGKANHGTAVDEATAPLLAASAVNGLPAVRFDGTDDALQVADSDSVSITGDITSFFVTRMDDFATFRAIWGKTEGNLPAPTDFYTLPGSGIPRGFRGNGAASLANVDGARPLRAGSFDLAGFSAAGPAFTHFLNGAPNGAGNISPLVADSDAPLWIGTRGDQFTRMKGDIAELLIYDSALSAAGLASVQFYLASKYSLALSSAVNDRPSVALTAPVAGSSVVAPAEVVMSATAADADGSVVKVEFLVNGATAATDLSAPFSAPVNFTLASTANLQARATDNLGGVTLSAPLSLTVTSTAVIPLPNPDRLRLWLRADKGVTETAGAVSAWADQAGFNNTAQTVAARQPTVIPNAINGKPALRFDGRDDSLLAPHSASLAITGEISSFFVVKFDDYATFNAVWAKTQGNQPGPTDFYTLPNSGLPQVYRGNGLGVNAASVGIVAAEAGSYSIMGFDHGESTLHHYLNGDWNGKSQITVTRGDTGRPLYVGTRDDQFTHLKGELAELIIYDTVLSDADRTTVNNYLSTRYGITLVTTPVPTLKVVKNPNGQVTVSWEAEATGWGLESSPNLLGPWTAMPEVVGNTVTLAPEGRNFFRLHRQ